MSSRTTSQGLRRAGRGALAALLACTLLPAAAAAGAGGTTYAPARTGGTTFDEPIIAAAPAARPVATTFTVSRSVAYGAVPKIVVRIDEPEVRTVDARLVILPLGSAQAALRIDLGRLRTGLATPAPWPKGSMLPAGKYLVRLHAKDPNGRTLRRKAQSSGRANLVVRAPKPVPAPPAPPAPAPPSPAPAPAPAPESTIGAVFPVQGPHTYGGDGARFGAGRPGHIHEGQDVLAAEGTPIVAPLAGTITYIGYQASSAGYWIAEHAADGHDLFFAHCQKDSTTVAQGQAVAAGDHLCNVGATGDASGPHLHFEIWVNGWRTGEQSAPIDPLPFLQSWDHP
jgi:murein DD-endopeptidase MepM/ murein hydrolase activator NlpD